MRASSALLLSGAASAPHQSRQQPQDPVQTPQHGMLVFVRPHMPRVARAAPSSGPSHAAPSHGPVHPSHSPVVGNIAWFSCAAASAPFPAWPGPTQALQTVGASEDLSGSGLLPRDLPQLVLRAWAPGGWGGEADRHPSSHVGLWEPGPQVPGVSPPAWSPHGCSQPLGVPVRHASPVSISLVPPVGHWPSPARLLQSPLSRATVVREEGPGALCGIGPATNLPGTLSPTVKWSQSSCSAVLVGLLRGSEGDSVSP